MADKQGFGKESYFAITRGPVSYSQQIDENVIADYDAGGSVVGLEFLDPGAAAQREKFLALAKQKSSGRIHVAKPPTLGRAA